ncbi:allophanate hydrolase, partial [Rhizobium ruizarguesonis]
KHNGHAIIKGPKRSNSIGIAALEIFDPASSRPSMMSPGDTVRFLPARIEL